MIFNINLLSIKICLYNFVTDKKKLNMNSVSLNIFKYKFVSTKNC